MQKKVNQKHVILLVTVMLTAQLILADTLIQDILDLPTRFHNKVVQLQGQVVNVVPPPNLETRGYYVLIDKSDKTIKIVSEKLPAPQKDFVVNGTVQIDPETQIPFVREISRVPYGAHMAETKEKTPVIPEEREGINPIILILIGLIVIIVIVLFVLLFKKPHAEEPVAREDIPLLETPQEEPIKTRQVSMEEVDREVGGIKTKEVPSLLAEIQVLSGGMTGKSFPLGYETTLGRISGDVILEDASVSREHAKISFKDEEYVIENKSKTNPVIVNGEKIQDQKELKDGDEIILGVIKMQFKLISP